jgi:AraC-like DNA-binding protein
LSNVEWLLREATDEQTLSIGQHTVIDDERWRASIERLQIGPGLRVFLSDVEARQDVTVEPRDDRSDAWMATQTTLAGAADIDFLDGVKTRASAEQMLMFRASQGAAAYSLKAGTRFHSAGYGLDAERIVRLFDGAPPPVLMPLLEREVERTRLLTARGDRRMRYLAGSLFGHGLNGPLRTLMMEGAVIQLLAVQAAAVAAEPRQRQRPSFTAPERDVLHDARRRLLADMRRPPTLGELAESVGLSDKRLNAGFRLLFGATVFEVLRNERLAHAHAVLEAEAVPLKEVARRVGYNHVTNFVSAFTQRYGAPPRQYIETTSRS